MEEITHQKQPEGAEENYQRTKMQETMIFQKLKEKGCRITKQRRLLLHIILQKECASCKEIYYKARKEDARIGAATVYRMINLLEEVGAISRKNMYTFSDEVQLSFTQAENSPQAGNIVQAENSSRTGNIVQAEDSPLTENGKKQEEHCPLEFPLIKPDGGVGEEMGCVIALDDHTTCCLSAHEWHQVIVEGLRACGYIKHQNIVHVTLLPCTEEEK